MGLRTTSALEVTSSIYDCFPWIAESRYYFHVKWGLPVIPVTVTSSSRQTAAQSITDHFSFPIETMNCKNKPTYPMRDIVNPHDHDVLSGRGNYVNYHAGNEHFRALVRKHKVAYVACPKPKKGTFSRTIVDEIRYRDPPGRFLKQDNETKMWYDIGDKKALDKTRQALREGAPELMKDLVNSDEEDEDDEPTQNHLHQVRQSTLIV